MPWCRLSSCGKAASSTGCRAGSESACRSGGSSGTFSRRSWRYAGPQGADDETDFAIVERRSVPQTNTTYFVVAGLTQTGTTGAVAFLAKFWKDLYRVYGVRDFAFCLKFNEISNDPFAHLKPEVVYCSPWRRIRRVVDHRRRASLGRMRVPPSQGSGDAGYTRSQKGMHRMTDDDLGFCAECSFEGSQDDVKEHARQFQHKYSINGEYLFTADFEGTISMGVTGCLAPKGMDPNLWVYANFCYRPGCGAAVKDDEVKDHIRSHVAKGE
jgi:hypothetical protein